MGQDPEVENAFINFIAKYQRSYSSKAEYPTRFENFKRAYYKIKEHNSNPERTYDLAINSFADKHRSERNFGLIPPTPEEVDLSTSTAPNFTSMITSNDVNWNSTTNYVSPAKD